MLGFSSLAVDVGLQRMTNLELSSACDAAAQAGAAYLDGTRAGVDSAIENAIWVGNLNKVYGDFRLGREHVTIGVFEDGVFVETFDPAVANAVQVSATHQVGSILANVAFGAETLPTQAIQTAAQTGSEAPATVTSCFLPFAMPDCHFDPDAQTNPDPMSFQFSNSNQDNVGWGLPYVSVSTRDIRNQLRGQCAYETLKVGDKLYKDNGSKTSALRAIRDILNGNSRTAPTAGPGELMAWPPPRDGRSANKPKKSDVNSRSWGQTLEGPVALVDMGPDCNNLNFRRGAVKITGFTYAYVYDVRSRGRDKNVWIQFDFMNEYDMGSSPDEDGVGNLVATGGGVQVVEAN